MKISTKDIARRQDISKKYLEQIAPILNRENILKTNRGFQGDSVLAQTPDKYTVGEILRLTEGSLSPVDCSDGEYAILPVWQESDRVINSYRDSVTLQDVFVNPCEYYGNDYVI